MINKFFIIAGLTAFVGLSAQSTHTVVKGDTAYNIAKRYGITVADLEKLNPTAQGGKITIGEVLKISSAVNAKASATPQSPTNSAKLGTIILKPKQTIYGLTKQYHISENDLRKLNPELDSHMKIGDAVTLPLAKIERYGDADVKETTAIATSNDTVAETKTEVSEAVVSGDEYTYTVQSKDNYYKLGRKFNLTQNELFGLNPGLEAKGLRAGDVIIVKSSGNSQVVDVAIPEIKTTTSTSSTTAVVQDDYVTYTVQNGDTVFGILNKFGVTLDDLLSLNPNLSQGLQAGMVLKIKKLDAGYVKKSGDALSVALMLPFGFDTNDTKYRQLSLDFLAGAKLAIERQAKSGKQLDVKVIDAGNEKSFKNSLTQINPNNTDLIIGPFFKSSVLEVLDYVKSSKIPVVAPFANTEDLLRFNNLVIIETNEIVYADRIIKEVKEVYQNQKIYVVADANQNMAKYMKSNFEKELKNPSIIIVNSAKDIALDQNMMTGQAAPVIAILASNNDGAAEDFTQRLIALSKETTGLKAFSMYYSASFENKETELHAADLVYIMDRKINTDGSFEKEILADYKKKYCKTPSKYAVIGFDVVNDMLSRENKKGEIFKQMNKVQTQLATKFEFEKSKSGAYVNKGYRVVRLVGN